MESLRELTFTDLYVCLSDQTEPARYQPKQKLGQAPGTFQVPPGYEHLLNSLVNQIRKEVRPVFSIDHDGMRMRGQLIHAVGGQEWAVMRRFPSEVPDLNNLNFSPSVLAAFREWGSRTGLVVIGGSTRAGKTTTACALLKDYLHEHLQTAITIEDPIEYDMQGASYPDGAFCLQMPVTEDMEWGERMRDALRAAPRYIFIGEIRTASGASQALRAANSGHLVICTVHGGRVEETLSAIVQNARPELGDMAISLLADGLVAVVHQRLEAGRPVNQILSTRDDTADPIRSIIRGGKLQTLSSEISKQATQREKSTPMSPPPRQVTPQAGPRVAIAPKKKSWW